MIIFHGFPSIVNQYYFPDSVCAVGILLHHCNSSSTYCLIFHKQKYHTISTYQVYAPPTMQTKYLVIKTSNCRRRSGLNNNSLETTREYLQTFQVIVTCVEVICLLSMTDIVYCRVFPFLFCLSRLIDIRSFFSVVCASLTKFTPHYYTGAYTNGGRLL